MVYPLGRAAVASSLLALALSGSLATPLAYDSPALGPVCRVMSDPHSPFQSGLAVLLALRSMYLGSTETPAIDPEIFEPIVQSLPALSMCVAETSMVSLLTVLATSPDAVQCWNDLSSLVLLPPANYTTSAIFSDTVCPAVATIAPCLTNVLVPAVETMMADTNGCCDALNDQITAAFGAPLRPTATSMVQLLDNVFCSERSTESSPPETCGDSLVRNWVPSLVGDDQKAFWSILNSFQIPNDQVCKAVNSEAFTTTMRTSQQYGSAEVTPFGLCYSQLDALTQYVCDLPVWTLGADASTVVSKASLFADGQCLRGSAFSSWASDENGSIMKTARAMDDVAAVLHGLYHGGVQAETPDEMGSGSGDSGDWYSHTRPPIAEEPVNDASGAFEPYEDPGIDWAEGNGAIEAPDPPLETPGPPQTTTKRMAPPMKIALARETQAQTPSTRRLLQAGGVADMARALFLQLGWFADSLCLHLPNGIQCEFAGESLVQPYPSSTHSHDLRQRWLRRTV